MKPGDLVSVQLLYFQNPLKFLMVVWPSKWTAMLDQNMVRKWLMAEIPEASVQKIRQDCYVYSAFLLEVYPEDKVAKIGYTSIKHPFSFGWIGLDSIVL